MKTFLPLRVTGQLMLAVFGITASLFGQQPTITTAPLSKLVLAGSSFTASVNATGESPLSYRWRRNGNVIAGASSSTLSIANASVGDRGWYQVTVTNSAGTVSSVFSVEVGGPNSTLVSWGEGAAPPNDLGQVVSVTGGAGGGHVLALRANGTVAGWGLNSAGETTLPANLTNVVSLATGRSMSFAVKADGTVVHWGAAPTPPDNVGPVVAVSAGWSHALALRPNGTVVAWGGNSDGQCNVPAGLRDVVAVAAGGFHSLALKADGSVVAWGSGNSGQTAVPDSLIINPNAIAIAGGTSHSVALEADGRVIAWGQNYSGSTEVPAALSNAIMIVAGESHSLALKSDGTVVAWGRNYEQQTNVPLGLSHASTIAAGSMQSYALVTNVAPAITQPPAGRTAAAGDYVELSVTATGTIPLTYQWKRTGIALANGGRISGATSAKLVIDGITAADAGGYTVEVSNSLGSITSSAAQIAVAVPPTITARPRARLTTIGESVTFTVGATDAGAISYQWKRNGQVIGGATGASLTLPNATLADRGYYEVVVANSAAATSSFFSLNVSPFPTADSVVVPWGAGHPVPPAGLKNVVAVAAGRDHGIALKSDGTVAAWGSPNFGATNVPADLADVVAVGAGQYFSAALKADGRVVTWGSYFSSPPAVPAGLRNVVAISVRDTNILALKSDGTVVSWYPGLAPPAGLSGVIAIAAGAGHNLALKSDGTVVSWTGSGGATTGAHLVPTGLADVVSIGVGDDHSLALKRDGTVVAWGRNDVGQATVPAGLDNVVAIDGGFVHSIALRADGTVVGWGRDNEGQVSEALRLGAIAAISGGPYYNYALAAATAPSFSQPPISRTVNVGDTITLGVKLTGAPLPTLQWRKDGVAISGATGTQLTLTSVQAANAGRYTVAATNSIGSVTSIEAVLSVVTPLTVNARPSSKFVVVGQPVSFAIDVSGATSYQWRRNGQVIAGATGATLAMPAATLSDRGYYEVVATAANGATARSVTHLNVAPARTFLMGWNSDGTAQSGVPGAIEDAVMVTSGGVCSALRANGTVVTWGFSSVSAAGLTDIVAVASGGSHLIALKADGTVTVLGGSGYSEQNVPAGLNNVVAISASGYNSLALRSDGTVVRWGYDYHGNHGVPAGLDQVVAIAAGDYHSAALRSDGTVVVWGSGSSSTSLISAPSTLTDVVAVAAGADSVMVIRRDGTPSIWGAIAVVPAGVGTVRAISVGGSQAMAQRTDGSLVTWGRAGYPPPVLPSGISKVIGFDANGVTVALIDSAPTPPAIVTQPASQAALYGSDVTLAVVASGTPVLSYQWKKNGTPIGVTTPSFMLRNVQSSDAGTYSVTITSSYGTVTSADAIVSVLVPAVSATSAPVVGGNVTLTTNTTGVSSYQWRYRGAPIAGATGATLTLHNLSRGQNGDYDVLLGQAGGGSLATHTYRLDVQPVASPDLYDADAAFAPTFEREGAGTILATLPLAGGKFLVGGDFTRLGSHATAYLARLNPDGSVDASFVPPQFSGPVQALLSQIDGRVVVGGDFAFVDGRRSGGVARLNTDLTVDTGFAVGQGFNDTVFALAQDANGRVLVGGKFMRFGADYVSTVARLNANGTRDSSFTYMGQPTIVRVLRVQSDGRIVFGGGTPGDLQYGPRGFVFRLNAGGDLDSTWRPNSEQGYRPNAPVLALLELADGDWLVGGSFPSGFYGPSVVRVNGDGTIDSSFSLDSALRTEAHSVTALAEAGGGRWIVAGEGLPVTRLNANGSRDASLPATPFSSATVRQIGRLTDGALRLWGTFQSTSTIAGYVDLAANGSSFGALAGVTPRAVAQIFDAHNVGTNHVLLRGDFTHVNDVARSGLVRLGSQGAVDQTFDAGAALGATNTGRLALQGDGKILVHNGKSLVRLLPDGSPDPTFSPVTYVPGDVVLYRDGGILISNSGSGGIFGSKSGVRKLTPAGAHDSSFSVTVTGVVSNLLVQASGRILLGGQYGSVNGFSSSDLVRVLENGSRDDAFSFPGGMGSRLIPAAGDLAYTMPGVMRLHATGADASFYYRDDERSSYFPAASALLPLPDGKFLRASQPHPDLTEDQVLHFARHLSSGAKDAAFQVNGLDRVRTVIDRILLTDEGHVWVFGQNLSAFGAPRLGVVRLVAGGAVSIAAPPVTAQAAPGGAATFSVTATGSGPVTYQWFRDGMRIPGATTSSLTISNLTVQDVAAYTVTVTNPFGSTTTAPVTITGPNPAPTITAAPISQLVFAGNPAVLSVSATGTGALAYQWRRYGTPVPGATAATFALPRASRTDAALYDVVVSDGLSVAVSAGAKLSVSPATYPNRVDVDEQFAPKFEAAGGTINAIEPVPGGGFVVSGDFSRINGVERPGLARLNDSLQVDTGFVPPAAFGDVNLSAWITVSRAKVLAVLPDGRVLVVRALPPIEGRAHRNTLVRLLPGGAVDPEFNASTEPENIARLVVQPDGKVIVLAQPSSFPAGKRGVYRLNGDGTLDAGFVPSFRVDNVEVAPDCVAVQPDGRILFGGNFTTVNGAAVPRIVRLLADGTLDSSFALTGFTWVSPRSLAVQDGRVLAGGSFSTNSVSSAYLVRLTASGGLDSALLQWPEANSMPIVQIVSGADGKTYVAGEFNGTPNGIGVWRISAAGAIERKYDVEYGSLPAIAPAGDGHVLINASVGETGRGLMRFAADGAFDGAEARVETTVGVHATVAAPRGQLYVSGPFTRVNGTPQRGLVRLNADGSRDPAFDVGAGFDSPPDHLLLLSNGGVAASGYFTRYRGADVSRVVKLRPDGSLDLGFVTQTSNNQYAAYGSMTLLLDGRLLVNGGTMFLPDGSIDGAFQTAVVGGAGVIALPDGGVLVGDNHNSSRRVVRLRADGSQTASGWANMSRISDIALQPEGRVVIGGGTFGSNSPSIPTLLKRLNANLTADDTFVASGIPMPTFITSAYQGPQFLAQEDGRILLNDLYQFGRIEQNGAWDPKFTVNGVKVLRLDPYRAKGARVFLLQDDGSLLLGDAALTVNGFRRHGLVRLIDRAAPAIATQPADQSAIAGDTVAFAVFASSPSATSYQWLKDGVAIAGATSDTLVLPLVEISGAGSYSVAITNTNGTLRSVAASLTIAPGRAPEVLVQPRMRAVSVGQSATFAVVATGAPAPTYRWRKSGVPIAGATRASFTLAAVSADDVGDYSVEVSNRMGTVVSASARLALLPEGLAARHALVGTEVPAGGTVTVTNTFVYSGTAPDLEWEVLLPEGWSIAASSGDAGATKPAAGTTGLARWAWPTVSTSPMTFNYTLNIPASADGRDELAALVTVQPGSGSLQLLATPDPLLLRRRHAADVDRDGRINLAELTRVIELYNTRHLTLRTGSYTPVDGMSEDGFAPDPGRAGNNPTVLPRYHSADSDTNGYIDVFELTRVIQLYNYRQGTMRTGEYRVQGGTEDGFASGP